jgi:hypothetical protein
VAGTPDVNPTVARRELAIYFHGLRVQRGRSLAELGAQLGVVQSQASRLDKGARGFRVEDVRRLCDWYGLVGGEADRLLALADEARRRTWWQQVEVPDSYRSLIGFEQVAETISEFCNSVVPGLLQTKRYAAAAARVVGASEERIEQAATIRMRRQAILVRPQPPILSVVVDEAVLARGAGGVDVMLEQLHHLSAMAQRPGVTIQVLEFAAGIYPPAPPQFILLQLGSRLPDFFYSEDGLTCFDSSDEDDLQRVISQWRSLQARAISPARSIELISDYCRRLE